MRAQHRTRALVAVQLLEQGKARPVEQTGVALPPCAPRDTGAGAALRIRAQKRIEMRRLHVGLIGHHDEQQVVPVRRGEPRRRAHRGGLPALPRGIERLARAMRLRRARDGVPIGARHHDRLRRSASARRPQRAFEQRRSCERTRQLARSHARRRARGQHGRACVRNPLYPIHPPLLRLAFTLARNDGRAHSPNGVFRSARRVPLSCPLGRNGSPSRHRRIWTAKAV